MSMQVRVATLVALTGVLLLQAPLYAAETDPATSQDSNDSVSVESVSGDPVSTDGVSTDPVSTDPVSTNPVNAKFDLRRNRPSFQARFFGGADLSRIRYGVGGAVEVGVGLWRWVDVHVGVSFPGYFILFGIEVNLVPFGRFVPTIGIQASWDVMSDDEARSIEMDVGCEFWILDWLAAYAKVGIGGTFVDPWSTEMYTIFPAWVGVEMRY